MAETDILLLFDQIPQNELSGEKGRALAELIAEKASAKFDRSIEAQKTNADFNRSAFQQSAKQPQRGPFQSPQLDPIALMASAPAAQANTPSATPTDPNVDSPDAQEPIDLESL